jgi:hypothetical protein
MRSTILLLVLTVPCAQAQQHIVAGMVADTRGAPIADALVQAVGTSWSTTTRTDGKFRLALPPGRWTLNVRRIGYAPRVTDVDVSDNSAATVAITLEEFINSLRGVIVTGERASPFSSTITTETVRQIPALGEPDIFRVLPMLPSVTQPNDLIGRVHLAGGASDEHKVRLDGHPLQAPFHVLSVLGAFNVAALDRADVQLHSLPLTATNALSGVIDLQTRKPKAVPMREGILSVLSASLTSAQRTVAETDIVASGRITYLDKVLGHLTSAANHDVFAPGFRDALLKAERRFAEWFSVAVLGYSTMDYWGSDGEKSAAHAPRWGENLGGITARATGSRGSVTARASLNRAFIAYRDSIDDPYSAARLLDFVNVSQRWWSGSLESELTSQGTRLRAGVSFDARYHTHEWSGTKGDEWFTSHTPLHFANKSTQTRSAAFGEVAFLNKWGNATLGSSASVVQGQVYVAPRVGMTMVNEDERLSFALAADRRYQFDAIAEEPREGTTSQPVYLLNVPRQSDGLAISSRWRNVSATGSIRGVEITAFRRWHRNRAALEPSSDAASVFPSFARVPGNALGATLFGEIATESGLVTQTSYTFQKVRERIAGSSQPTSWDVPHAWSLFAAYPIRRGLSLTGAVQIRSGAATTPVRARILTPVAEGVFVPRFIYGAPNSARLPGYQRFDFGVRQGWHFRGAEWAVSAQVLNAFARTNALALDWSTYFRCLSGSFCDNDALAARKGLPMLPSVGLEIRW